MPYAIRRREREYCVYRMVGGRAVGDALGCHDTKTAAIRQIGAIESAERRRENRGGARVVRAAGLRYMFLAVSNPFIDREGEFVSLKALTDYAAAFNRGEIKTQPLDYNHKIIIGDVAAAAVWDGFLVEIAKERPTPAAKVRWDFIEATPWLDWGCSHQFIGTKRDKARGVFVAIVKERTTVLRRRAAANVVTGAGVIRRG